MSFLRFYELDKITIRQNKNMTKMFDLISFEEVSVSL